MWERGIKPRSFLLFQKLYVVSMFYLLRVYVYVVYDVVWIIRNFFENLLD